jgi:hypothetical protein
VALRHQRTGLLAGGVRIWIDECLSPALVGEAQRRGYQAKCTRAREHAGAAEPTHRRVDVSDCQMYAVALAARSVTFPP